MTAQSRWPDDNAFQERAVTKVEPSGAFTMDDGWCFWCPEDSPVKPKVGSVVRLYGRGIGYGVRGLYIDGVRAFYRTEAEDEQKRKDDEERRENERRREWDDGGRRSVVASRASPATAPTSDGSTAPTNCPAASMAL
jgi:hypothetical protein